MAELTPGMRMKLLFETAKAATSIPPNELERLFAEPSYGARLAAFCILDFQPASGSATSRFATPTCATTAGSTTGAWSTGLHLVSSARP
jgi:hypothetical protein